MKKARLFLNKKIILSSLFIVFATILLMSCNNPLNVNSGQSNSPGINGNSAGIAQQQVTLSMDNPAIKAIVPVQKKYTPELMKKNGVVGTAIGLDNSGKPAILVLTQTDIQAQAKAKGEPLPIPAKLDNVAVRVYVTGKITTLQPLKGNSNHGGGNSGHGPGGGSGTTVSHTAIQSPPIALGTSGGWEFDNSNGYCCSGTLGSLVTDGTNQYILSNFHVFYGDVASGGNNRVATGGDPVIQPGLVDVNCDSTQAQKVASLVSGGGSLYNTTTHTWTNANIDAGIALVRSGMVKSDGSILEIGTISKNTVAASINQPVKKSGRTTGLTTSSVIGINATLSVSYDDECAGSTVHTNNYTGQILVDNKGSKFLDSGDSGSLMVENTATNPRAVGLLFAGSKKVAVANPINEVLNYYSQKFGNTFTMVGQ
ncbi:MAG TPA: hypothetical protein VKA34_09750 [Balneolales bacterium]|nr:hypothetical protein [Balneolales bacterium]